MKHFLHAPSIAVRLFVAVWLLAGCSGARVESRWRSHEINPNGLDEEWSGTPQYYDEKKQVVVKIMNDDESIYLCVAVNDRELKKKLMMSGLTVWIDPEGGKERKYGVRLAMKQRRRPSKTSNSQRDQRMKEERDRMSAESPPPFKAPESLEVIHPFADESSKMTMEVARHAGVAVGVGRPNGRLVFEYRIRTGGENYVLSLDMGSHVGIGIESGKMGGGVMMGKGGPGGAGHGKRNRGMGGPAGGGKGEPGRRRPEAKGMGEPFEVWLKVLFSSPYQPV